MADWIVFCFVWLSMMSVYVHGDQHHDFHHRGPHGHGPPPPGNHDPPHGDPGYNQPSAGNNEYEDDNDETGPPISYVMGVALGCLALVFVIAAIAVYRLKRSKLRNKIGLDPRNTSVVSNINYPPPPYEPSKKKRSPLPPSQMTGMPPVERTAPPAYDYVPPRTPPPPYTINDSGPNYK